MLKIVQALGEGVGSVVNGKHDRSFHLVFRYFNGFTFVFKQKYQNTRGRLALASETCHDSTHSILPCRFQVGQIEFAGNDTYSGIGSELPVNDRKDSLAQKNGQIPINSK